MGITGHRAGGEETDSSHCFVYLGGAVCGSWKTEREVCIEEHRPERTHGEQLTGCWRTGGSPKRLNDKVMSTCVTPACLYGTETLAMTELQQQRLQVCENNWVRKIARVTRADRRRMVALREEMGVKSSLAERQIIGAGYSGQDT